MTRTTTIIDRVAGTRLRAARSQRRLSLLALATRAGTSPTTLYGAERYGRVPRNEVRERIAAALGVPAATIWCSAGHDGGETIEEDVK